MIFVEGKLVRFKQNHRALTKHNELQGARSPFNTNYCAFHCVPGCFSMPLINSELDHVFYVLSRNPSMKLKLTLQPFRTRPGIVVRARKGLGAGLTSW